MSLSIKEIEQKLIDEFFDGLHPEWATIIDLKAGVAAIKAEAQAQYDAQVTE